MGEYRTGAVCLKGHPATSDTHAHPATDFCEVCGSKVITACPECEWPIRGRYDVPGVFVVGGKYTPPAFCYHCGSALPWTQEKLAAAKELADELDEVTPDDKKKIKEALDDVASDGPRTTIGAARLKKLLGDAGSAVGKATWKIAIEVASEAAKKIMLGQ